MKNKILCKSIWFDDNKYHDNQPINIKTGIILNGLNYKNIQSTFNILNEKKIKKNLFFREKGYLTNDNKFITEIEYTKYQYLNGELEI